MVQLSNLLSVAAAALFASPAVAHPGGKHDALQIKCQIEARNAVAVHSKRSLQSCAGSLKHRQLMERAVSRRAESAKVLREERGITSSELAIRIILARCMGSDILEKGQRNSAAI